MHRTEQDQPAKGNWKAHQIMNNQPLMTSLKDVDGRKLTTMRQCAKQEFKVHLVGHNADLIG